MDWLKIWDNTKAYARLIRVYWGLFNGDVVFVGRREDLPEPEEGVRYLLPEKTYYFARKIDLVGGVLVGGENTVVLGFSSENSAITSTGKPASTPLFSSVYTTPIRHITFYDVDVALYIDGDPTSTALDWTGVNFLNVPSIGNISNCSNFIFTKGAFINSKGLVFDGEISTVGFNNSSFVGDGDPGSIISIASTATITRRFRIIYSAVVAFDDTIAIDVDINATIPIDSYILDTVDFSGGGTYISGVQYDDNKAKFANCKGITNSRTLGWGYFINNASTTIIVAPDTPVEMVGSITLDSISQRFEVIGNRMYYRGALTEVFEIEIHGDVEAGNNNQVKLYVAVNGSTRSESVSKGTTGGNNRFEGLIATTFITLNTDDYISGFLSNSVIHNILAENAKFKVK